MQFIEIARVWEKISQEASRRGKADLLATLLGHLDENEIALAVAYCCGELPQRQIGVGWATLRELPPPAADARLTVRDVDAALTGIKSATGRGSQVIRRERVDTLFGQLTLLEQRFLRRLLFGELRQGALAGVMVEAVAKATMIPAARIRHALTLQGDLPTIATVALVDGEEGLNGITLTVGRALAPMLAATARSTGEALAKLGRAVVEEKLDGVRIQVHKNNGDVAIFTRSLDEITGRLPSIVEAVRGLPVRQCVLDGEVISVQPDGTPQPFQVTASHVGSQPQPIATGDGRALRAAFFDVLHLNGMDLVEVPLGERLRLLEDVITSSLATRRIETDNPEQAEQFFRETLERGHEGVVIKAVDAAYAAGRRGGSWIKVKPVRSADLVILAVEWGYGRRKGWLSNVHLGARDPEGEFGQVDGFVMLGKTFKGMTDEMLRWQTARFRELAISPLDDYVVRVRPMLVAEVEFDGVQASTRYPGGVTLRFARVKGYRSDKSPAECDTIGSLRALLQQSG